MQLHCTIVFYIEQRTETFQIPTENIKSVVHQDLGLIAPIENNFIFNKTEVKHMLLKGYPHNGVLTMPPQSG